MRRHVVVFATGLLLLLFLCGVEFSELFFPGYIFIKVLCVYLALLFFPLGTFLNKKNPTVRSSMSTVIVCLLLLIFGFTIEFIPTSPRKRFYVLANRIKVGDPVEKALTTLKDYDTSTRYYQPEDSYYVYSQFVPELGTTDRVLFDYDLKTRKITKGPDYSPD